MPSETLQENYPSRLDSFIREHSGKSCFIFHCHLSQVRGPSCARLFLNRWRETREKQKQQEEEEDIKVLVLEGGWKRWKDTYGHDPALTVKIP